MIRRLRSLEARLGLLLLLAGLGGALVYVGITAWPLPQLLDWLHADLAVGKKPPMRLGMAGALAITLAVLVPAAWWMASLAMSPVSRLLRALEGSVASYRDGDFSISLAVNRSDELGERGAESRERGSG